MANYHFTVGTVSRGKGKSITKAISYIGRMALYDEYKKQHCRHFGEDLLCFKIYLPANAPPRFSEPQVLCNEIDKAEKRYDARTARTFICSLPNELPLDVQVKIVEEFVQKNFTSNGLCAVVAIHDGKNDKDPSHNNPHAHIIVPTRTLDEKGFSAKKDREHDKKHYVKVWREDWAKIQNRAYERNGLEIRVSHESLEVQGIDREPTIHLSQRDWQREQKGERTVAGDKKRAIRKRNQEKELEHQRNKERWLELDRSR